MASLGRQALLWQGVLGTLTVTSGFFEGISDRCQQVLRRRPLEAKASSIWSSTVAILSATDQGHKRSVGLFRFVTAPSQYVVVDAVFSVAIAAKRIAPSPSPLHLPPARHPGAWPPWMRIFRKGRDHGRRRRGPGAPQRIIRGLCDVGHSTGPPRRRDARASGNRRASPPSMVTVLGALAGLRRRPSGFAAKHWAPPTL